MKKLLIVILILFNLKSYAQNWQSVIQSQHSTYRVIDTSTQLLNNWDGYIRSVWIDGATTTSNGMLFLLNPSLRRAPNGFLDLNRKSTWLGSEFERHTNGIEFFRNKYFDTILIRTLANLNDSWLMAKDTNGSREFTATITQVGTTVFNGVIDSIKTISIQATQSSLPINSVYNNLKIVLSKNNGILECFDFYGFPNFEVSEFYDLGTNSTNDQFPTLPLKHIKLEDSVRLGYKFQDDIHIQYQVGNSWITKNDWYFMDVHYDSVENITLFGSDTIVAQIRRREHIPTTINGGTTLSSYFNDTTFLDTVIQAPFMPTFGLDSVEYNNWTVNDTIELKYLHHMFIDTFCNDWLSIHSQTENRTFVSAQSWSSFIAYAIIDLDRIYIQNTLGSQQGYSVDKKIIYLNINGCQMGTFIPLSNKRISKFRKNSLSIYPNPSLNTINIELNENHKIQVHTFYAMDGQQVLKSNTNKLIDISALRPGIYIIKSELDNKIFLSKFNKL